MTSAPTVTLTAAVTRELELLEQLHGLTNRDVLNLSEELDRLPRNHHAVRPLCQSLSDMLLMLWPSDPHVVTDEARRARDHRRALVTARTRGTVA